MSRWSVIFVDKIKKLFNFGNGTPLKQIEKDYFGKTGSKNLTYRTLTRWVWTKEFRLKVLNAHYGRKLKDQTTIDDMFPNYGVTKSVVKGWVSKYKETQWVSFLSNTSEVNKKFYVTVMFIRRVVELILDQENFSTPKQILVKLEKDDNRSYSRSILDKCSRTLFFHHLILPWAFLYFLGVVGKDWLKIGRSQNYNTRVNTFETILIEQTVIHLILRYPLRYELEVDQWFRDKYYAYRVFKSHDDTLLKKNKKNMNEFYQLIVLDMFKNMDNQTITLKGKDGSDFQVTLEKVLPDSKEFAALKTLQAFFFKLRQIDRNDPQYATSDDVECEFDPEIENHPDLIVYPERFHKKSLARTGKLSKDVDLVVREKALKQREQALAAGQHDLAARENALKQGEQALASGQHDLAKLERTFKKRKEER